MGRIESNVTPVRPINVSRLVMLGAESLFLPGTLLEKVKPQQLKGDGSRSTGARSTSAENVLVVEVPDVPGMRDGLRLQCGDIGKWPRHAWQIKRNKRPSRISFEPLGMEKPAP